MHLWLVSIVVFIFFIFFQNSLEGIKKSILRKEQASLTSGFVQRANFNPFLVYSIILFNNLMVPWVDFSSSITAVFILIFFSSSFLLLIFTRPVAVTTNNVNTLVISVEDSGELLSYLTSILLQSLHLHDVLASLIWTFQHHDIFSSVMILNHEQASVVSINDITILQLLYICFI